MREARRTQRGGREEGEEKEKSKIDKHRRGKVTCVSSQPTSLRQERAVG
jgi:hypothetical protein